MFKLGLEKAEELEIKLPTSGAPSKKQAAKSPQLCQTLCNHIDGSPPGPPVTGILQARTLEWVAISFSNAWKWKVKMKSLSRVCLFPNPWTAAYQAFPSMGFSTQEYWSGVPLPSLKSKRVPEKHLLCLLHESLWLCVSQQTENFLEIRIRDHLTRLLINLYAGQEATVRTGHGTKDWFQIRKGVHQGCILSPCLFNLYAEYIMHNAGLNEVKLEARFLGEISVTSDRQMTPPLWQKVKRN